MSTTGFAASHVTSGSNLSPVYIFDEAYTIGSSFYLTPGAFGTESLINNAGTKIYFVNTFQTLSVYDIATGVISTLFLTGLSTIPFYDVDTSITHLAISADDSLLFVSNDSVSIFGSSVGVVNTTTFTLQYVCRFAISNVANGSNAGVVALSPTKLYAALDWGGTYETTLVAFDLATNCATYTSTRYLPDAKPAGIYISPDHTTLYIVNTYSFPLFTPPVHPSVVKVDAATGAVLGRIQFAGDTISRGRAYLSSDGNTFYVLSKTGSQEVIYEIATAGSMSLSQTINAPTNTNTPNCGLAPGPDNTLWIMPGSFQRGAVGFASPYALDITARTFSNPIAFPYSAMWVSFLTTVNPPPPPRARPCIRLTHPSGDTIEQITDNVLSIFVDIPIEVLNLYISMIPNAGADILVINYVDEMGQAGRATRQVTFWMSDSGYVFLSSDGKTQFLIAGVRGAFFDTHASTVNARNAAVGATALAPCSNASRYDYPVLLSNQVRPEVWIRDGIYEAPSSGSG